jgi:hypothetical protein
LSLWSLLKNIWYLYFMRFTIIIEQIDGVNFDVEHDDDVERAEQLLPDVLYQAQRGRPRNVAMNYINAITGYFSSPAGAVPW